MEKIKIGIAGMSRGAGASLVTLLLAEELAAGCPVGSVTVAAGNNLYYYDSLGFDQRFGRGSFIPFEEYLSREKSTEPPNIDEGISWLVSSPKTIRTSVTSSDRARILSRIDTKYLLWDMGYDIVERSFTDASRDVDMIIFVIDPLPSKMLPTFHIIEKVRDSELPVIYIVNKMNSGIDKKNLLNFLKIKKPVMLPAANPAVIYKSEYKCINPYRDADLRKNVMAPIAKITDIIEDIRKHL